MIARNAFKLKKYDGNFECILGKWLNLTWIKVCSSPGSFVRIFCQS